MDNSLDVIKERLKEQQAKIAVKADELRSALAELDDDQGRIDAALAALAGTALASSNGKKQEKRKTLAPSATKVQVVSFIAEELKQQRLMQEEELRARVEKKLVNSGYSRMGYKLRFKEALADPQFLRTPGGIQLGKEATSGQPPSVRPV